MKDLIKKELGNSIDEMAPDILASILETKIDRNAFSDEDLRDEPLFLDEAKTKNPFWAPIVGIACVVMLMIVAGFTMNFINIGNPNAVKSLKCTITLDVNPSIDIQVNNKGLVTKIVANNEDAVEIVEKINSKLVGNETVEDVMQIAVKRIKKAGYLEDDSSAMLVSVEKNNEGGQAGLGEARKTLNNYKKESGNTFVTVYQEYEENDEVKKVAEKNKVSKAKAAYCIKVAEKTEETQDELCQETIATITSIVVEGELELGQEIDIVEEIENLEEITSEGETTTIESETTTVEGETITEDTTEEITTVEGETTTVSEEVTSESETTRAAAEETTVAVVGETTIAIENETTTTLE